MLDWAATVFGMAIVAAMLGFTDITGPAIGIAKVLFYVFLVVSVVMYILGRRGPVPLPQARQ